MPLTSEVEGAADDAPLTEGDWLILLLRERIGGRVLKVAEAECGDYR